MRKKKKLSTILKSKKFFINIRNHSVHLKYETKLKSLGAIISPFLDKEVNYVLTDIHGCNGKVPVAAETSILSPQCYSVSPATSVSGDDSSTSKKTRTRAGAMLERIPVQTQASSLNPISDAILWNIPVYSIEYFQNWLEKKLTQVQVVNEKNDIKCQSNTRIFEKKYLKLESVIVNRYRPEFKEVSKWPCIDTNTIAGSCPFDRKTIKKPGKKENADKKEESERINRNCDKTANDSGYCEICAVHYSDLSQHISSNSHLKFICNEKNYVDLDNCIRTRSVEAFLAAHNSTGSSSQLKETNSKELMGRNLKKSVSLHLNNNNENSAVTRSLSNAKLLADESLKQPLQVQCNGFTTNYHLRKTTKSDGALIKSPGYFASKDLLRESRKPYASCPDGVTQNKDPQLSSAKEENVHRLRSRKSLLLPSILLNTTAEDGANKNRGGISPQTSASNRFLRSSMSPKSQTVNHATRSRIFEECRKSNVSNSTCMSKEPGNASGMYFTRSKLCGTSPNGDCKKHCRSSVSPKDENRVNGRQKRKSSVVSDEEDGREKSSVSPRHVPSYQSNRKIKNVCNDASQSGLKKRMSCEEKFLEDNREYYKVEMLRTKLRSTEFYCNQEINQVPPVKEEKKEANDSDDEPVVMRFRKIKQRKQSALHLLNLEAENFLFGPPKAEDDNDDTSKGSDDEDNKEEESKNESDNQTRNNFKPGRKKKSKRRTHAEVFIHDNLDYYRFEISSSRLRHQSAENESILKNDVVPEKPKTLTSCGTPNAVKIKEESISDAESELPLKKRMKARKKEISESERAETTKPSEKCAEKSDKPDKSEKSEKSDKSEKEELEDELTEGCYTRVVPAEPITFSFESIPAKESWYKTFQRFDTCEEFYIPVSNSYISRINKVPNSRNSRSSNVLNENGVSPFHRRKKLSRLGRLIAEDKPRKSPRCHASTLAILSSLTNHRRRSRKMHSIEMRKSHENQRRSENDAIRQATAALNSSLEQEARLKETLKALAKNADEHFIEIFGNEDCRDRYLEKVRKSSKDEKWPIEESHCCMQLDEEIFQDEDFLNCFVGGSSDVINDMAAFMESAQRCNSMEVAQDEECIIPRSNDLLSRVCREDYSCNSSDCGASSTCEFLGFAEDGRTVSRKRKRKKPNMTGWPHNNRRRRNIRFLDVNRNGGNSSAETDTEVSRSTIRDNVSEADSECTDDDIPLSQIVSRKRRRTNSVIVRENIELKRDCETVGKASLRRSSRGGGSALPYKRRLSYNQNRRTRRSRCN